ncbi:hypothetical protein ALON55S_08436 [Alishewanella longhuensis]
MQLTFQCLGHAEVRGAYCTGFYARLRELFLLFCKPMTIASHASEITLPAINQGWPTVLAFLITQFPRIPPDVWQARIQAGKVHWYQGECLHKLRRFYPVVVCVITAKWWLNPRSPCCCSAGCQAVKAISW